MNEYGKRTLYYALLKETIRKGRTMLFNERINSEISEVKKELENHNRSVDDNEKLSFDTWNVYTEEDLIVYALSYLCANIEHAFEPLEGG